MNNKINKSLQFRNYLMPKYWPLWFVIGILRLIAYLPIPLINKIGSVLGILIYHLVPSRRHVAIINLKQAFPDLTDTEIESFCKKTFKNMGASFLEMGPAWFTKTSTLQKICSVEGKQYLDVAVAKNKGVILLTGHFTTLEIGGSLLGLYIKKYNAIFKTAHNPLFNALMVHYRSKKINNDLIDAKNVRAFARGLKNGHVTWYAPDQDFHRQEIVFTPFLGGMASTLTATAKMAKLTGAAVVPFYQIRLDNGKGYKIIFLPALENFPSGDIYNDSAQVNKAIEEMVYACPEQYLWSHKRFKTQPDGRDSIYKTPKQ